MYFLIDYENVNYAGLEGTEFLEKGDTVSIFFSGVSDKIVAYRMKDIERSGCNFEICKLRNVRKNALDFYIASKQIIVEIDGSQHYEAENRKKDETRDGYFAALGCTVLRYSNADVNLRFRQVCEDIYRYVIDER